MGRVLHVFYNFLPDVSGSSIRSAGILSGQSGIGMEASAVTSPFQPGFGPGPVETVSGIRVHRTFAPGNPQISERGSSLRARLRKLLLFPGFARAVRRVAEEEQADVIHAHSTFYCALAALVAGRMGGQRVVYEFRSLWEERARSKGFVYRMQSRLATWIETACLRAVDHVVAINDALRDLVVARGVDRDRVTVVPNAVEDAILETGRSVATPSSFRRFGYVGNFSSIEGLDLLVQAFTRAFPPGVDVTLDFWGVGPLEPELRALVVTTGDARVTVHGRFAREQLRDVYAGLDAIVLARRRSLLTDTVTPLKPLESMAFGRLVLASDVGGLLEVTGGSANAAFFRADDVDDLARALREAHARPDPHRALAESGRAFARGERAWTSIASRYRGVYGRP